MAGDWRSKIHSPVNDVMSVQTPIKNKYFYEHAQTVFDVTVQSAVKLKRALNVLSPDVCSIFLCSGLLAKFAWQRCRQTLGACSTL